MSTQYKLNLTPNCGLTYRPTYSALVRLTNTYVVTILPYRLVNIFEIL